MVRTVDEVLIGVRQILQDTVAPYRYKDVDLIGYLNASFGEIRRLRSDVFFPFNAPLPVFTVDDVDQGVAFPIEDYYFQPVVYFVAGSAELRDDEFTVDSRAGLLLKKFESSVLGMLM